MLPRAMVGIAGVTAMDTRAAGVTVKVVEPLIAPEVAVTVVLPKATLLARPWLLMVATLVFAVVQATEFVRTSVLPSL